MNRLSVLLVLISVLWPSYVFGAGDFYVGALGGLSTLSGDARSVITPSGTAISLYKPENGSAVNVFVGRHLFDYLSLQANYVWNRNNLTFTSASFSTQGQTLYQQMRSSSQQSVLGDLLLYFRNRRSFARPYLSVGTGFVRLRSAEERVIALAGSPVLPPRQFTSTKPALRVAVGIDLAIGGGWAFRYSFSETISPNAISAQLSPPGERGLKNFQNLFGLVKNF